MNLFLKCALLEVPLIVFFSLGYGFDFPSRAGQPNQLFFSLPLRLFPVGNPPSFFASGYPSKFLHVFFFLLTASRKVRASLVPFLISQQIFFFSKFPVVFWMNSLRSFPFSLPRLAIPSCPSQEGRPSCCCFLVQWGRSPPPPLSIVQPFDRFLPLLSVLSCRRASPPSAADLTRPLSSPFGFLPAPLLHSVYDTSVCATCSFFFFFRVDRLFYGSVNENSFSLPRNSPPIAYSSLPLLKKC